MQEGQIVEVHILQQHKVELKDLKKGTMFKVVTAGKDGEGREESSWQIAMMDPTVDKETGNVKFKADTLTMMIGTPNVVDVISRGEVLDMKKSQASKEYLENSAKPIKGATIQ